MLILNFLEYYGFSPNLDTVHKDGQPHHLHLPLQRLYLSSAPIVYTSSSGSNLQTTENINSHSRDIQHLNHLMTRTLTAFVSVLYSSLGQLLFYLFCYRLSVNSLLYQFLFAFLFTQRFCRQTAHKLVLQILFLIVCFLC